MRSFSRPVIVISPATAPPSFSVSVPAVPLPADASIVRILVFAAPLAVTVFAAVPILRVASAVFVTVAPSVPVTTEPSTSASVDVTVKSPAPVKVSALPSTIPPAVTIKVLPVAIEAELVPCPKTTVDPSDPVTLKPSV